MSNANEVDVDVATPTPKKKSCLTRDGWIDMLWCYKILIGTGLLFVSCNDYLIHFIKKEPFTFVGLICSLNPNTSAIEYVLTFHLLYLHLLYRHLLYRH